MNRNMLRRNFITGLLVVLPIILTVWILTKVFFLLTDFLFNVIKHFYPFPNIKIDLLARFGSLVIIFFSLVLLGMLARNVFGKRLLHFLDVVCMRIPIFGRIVAVADVYDALSSPRCYKEVWNEDQTLEEIHENAGKHSDPEVTEAFFSRLDVVKSIAERFPEKKE